MACRNRAMDVATARGAGKRATYVLQADLDAMEARHATITAGMLAEIKALTAQVADAEARGFAQGQKANPATTWGWAAANGGDGWLLCPMVLRGQHLVTDTDAVRGMIFGEPGRAGYAAVRRLGSSRYSKRIRRKTMKGACNALAKLMGEPLPALPDSLESR